MTSVQSIWKILEQIADPEIPVLSIVDLGIVREVSIAAHPIHSTLLPGLAPGFPAARAAAELEVTITPTYSGCPAMDVIALQIRMAFLKNGFQNIIIKQQLSPAWTTDWLSENGKQKLKAFGIAPPQAEYSDSTGNRVKKLFSEHEMGIECPQCRSKNTHLLSQFGSTACKALYKCQDCKEPFDYFKCH